MYQTIDLYSSNERVREQYKTLRCWTLTPLLLVNKNVSLFYNLSILCV